ncbi:MAG TPA: oxidoreductase [Mycobacteriales bacterium]|nr:oxidoreductase [Mycobacteriales bacterium]
MGLFRRKQRPGTLRRADSEDVAHLVAWAQSRTGVEAYVEPRTAVTDTTMALVARDGEWTRRRVEDERAAAELGKRLGIPVYDVHRTGYPPRMREWTRRRSEEEKAARRLIEDAFGNEG